MPDHDITRLERHVTGLRESLRALVDDAGWEDLIRHWRTPGWTTPAEFLLVDAALATLSFQAEAMLKLRGQILEASGEIVRATEGAGKLAE